jgi:sarcosine oxidase subunit beta
LDGAADAILNQGYMSRLRTDGVTFLEKGAHAPAELRFLASPGDPAGSQPRGLTRMERYNAWTLLRHSLVSHTGWAKAWRDDALQSQYDVVIVGGGGHGLATAYYLARKHGIRRVAVLEKSWIGGGNSGRNTQVSRSNYFYPESCAFYDHSLKLYETLGRELNFNVMLSQRGILSLAHSEHELEISRRWMNAILMNGVDARMLTTAEIRKRVPILNLRAHYPVVGGFIQERAGISRHDAVVWAYARAASSLGVHIIQNCEVHDFLRNENRVIGVETNLGRVHAGRTVLCTAGSSSVLAAKLGLKLPLTTMTLQAMVTEPVKPILDTIVVSPTIHAYLSQSDRGEIVIGAGADAYNSYSRRGGVSVLRNTIAATLELFPCFSRLRLMRQWGGAVDVTPDTSPIMGLTPIEDLYINCGWGTGGYKAIPAGGDTMAHTIAHGKPHALIEPFSLDRFRDGALIDEGAAAGVAH